MILRSAGRVCYPQRIRKVLYLRRLCPVQLEGEAVTHTETDHVKGAFRAARARPAGAQGPPGVTLPEATRVLLV